jgi:hypothetical protein
MDQPLQKTRSSGVRRQSVTDDIGEFEDAWEDEIEEDEVAQNPTNDPDGLSTLPSERIEASDCYLTAPI